MFCAEKQVHLLIIKENLCQLLYLKGLTLIGLIKGTYFVCTVEMKVGIKSSPVFHHKAEFLANYFDHDIPKGIAK